MTGRKLPITLSCMSKETDWLSGEVGRRVTVTEIANLLGISRRTATNRLNDGLSADELIAISRALNISPIHALIELGKLTLEEAFAFVDGDGRLLANANEYELLFELAKHQLPISMLINLGDEGRNRILEREKHPATKAPTIDELAERRNTTPKTPPSVEPLSDDEIAQAIRDAHQLRGAAHPATTELTEPESP